MPILDSNKIVTINSRKIDGKIHKSWKAELIETNHNLLKFVGKFEKEIKHEHLGVIRRGTVSYEFYWLDRGFNVFRFHEPEGNLRNFYCNINLPPQLENNVLELSPFGVEIFASICGSGKRNLSRRSSNRFLHFSLLALESAL
ncbi:MAG: DUF402 domain-containing protein [Acidobacteria bacterium]|nr:DUF402 domain-containing protein [Acidobacteriota bacterium]